MMRSWVDKDSPTYIQFVLGILQRKTGALILQNIPDRRAASILPHIEKHVPPGKSVSFPLFSFLSELFCLFGFDPH